MNQLKEELLSALHSIHPFWLLDTRMERFEKYPLRTIWNGVQRRLFYKALSAGILKDKNKKVKVFYGKNIIVPIREAFYLKKGFYEGEELRLTKFLIRALNPGDIFIDGGAYIGWYSILAAHLVERERERERERTKCIVSSLRREALKY